MIIYNFPFFLLICTVPPMLWIPHQLIGVYLYSNATLECIVEAHPTSLNFWSRENEKMIYESQKYK